MDTFLRYFPAAESMYQIFLALAIGLIVKGDGLTGVDALYRLLGKLHIQPVTDRFSVRLFTCIQLYLEGKIKIRDFGRYLKKEKCEPMEEIVLELTKATDLTTAELLACVEQGATAKNPKEVWNLYLNKQISFQQF